MSRLEVNRSGEMEVFVRVVELGGFSAAARALRMTPSAVSKLVARLEARLGARLVNRSTRRIELTAEGSAFYERAVRVLADLDDAERGAAARAAPHGRVRINANVPFGDHFLLPLVPEFLALYPDIQLDIVLTDQVIDLMEERTDVAIRAGELKSSQLMARKLGETRMVVVGAPAYLARCGTPRVPADLAGHNCLKLGYARAIEGWPMLEGGQATMVAPLGNAMTSNGDALRRIVVGGLGLARMAVFQVREDIAAGRLVPLLEAFNPGDLEAVHAVYLGQGRHLPARVRALLDFLAQRVEMGT